ncbi:MAG: HDIG domain-containing protein [Syntrophorhabdaceae bacterium]|nr:HDIG domain-containing protein [Syntrophorhabdaceae bacterium]
MSVSKTEAKDNCSAPEPGGRRDFQSARLLIMAAGASAIVAILFYFWEMEPAPRSMRRWGELFLFMGAVVFTMAAAIFLRDWFVAARKEIRKLRATARDFLFLFSLSLILFVAAKGVSTFLAVTPGFGRLTDPRIYACLIPLSALAMVVRVLISFETAIMFTVAASVLSTAAVSGRWPELLFLLLSGTAGACVARRITDRYKVLRAGTLTVPVSAITAGALEYAFSGGGQTLQACVIGAVNGILAGPVALAVMPVAELVFGYTSDIRLTELGSANHPLLSRLMKEAPGTFHHSLIVGALSEAGAHAIGANAAVCRVAALYHDIGKAGKPQYYSENQAGTENLHDALSPGLSRTVILSHVKEGVKMVREAGFGDRVAEIIEQHHGTSILYCFLDKAKPMIQDRKASEEMFRYPGPCPKTKEAAIVMIADATEATVRSMRSPSSQEVKEAVTGIINRAYLDGQLNECEMTLRDLSILGESIGRVLIAIAHRRVDYPASGSGLADEET